MIEKEDLTRVKFDEEAARIKRQISDAFERGRTEGMKFTTNVRDETQDGKWKSNLLEHKGWAIAIVIAIIVVVGWLMAK